MRKGFSVHFLRACRRVSVGGEHDVGSPRVSVWDFPLSDGNKVLIPFLMKVNKSLSAALKALNVPLCVSAGGKPTMCCGSRN